MSDLELARAEDSAPHPPVLATAAWRRYAEWPNRGGRLPEIAYTEDPFKQMVRYYDKAVVRAGGASIFTIRAYASIF